MDDNPAKMLRAMDLHRQGHLSGAEKLYREILQQQPTRADALYLLGLVLLANQNYQRAADLIGKSIKYNPNFPPAYCNRGIALAKQSRYAEALGNYDKAIALDPSFSEAYYNRGTLLDQLGRHEDAIASFDHAIMLRPDDAEAYNNRGNALSRIKRHQQALASLDKAIALRPDFAAALCNHGNAMLGLNRPADALASYDRALAVKPDLAVAYCNRGDALHELGRPEEALTSFDRAIALQPALAEAWFGKSLTLLLLGRYEEGFRDHEWRKRRTAQVKPRSFRQPLWLGDADIRGKTLFIHPELFLGDMIQFCRYARLAGAQGARVILAVPEPLRGLLASLGSGITVVGEHTRPDRFDYHCPLMSLPLAFRTTRESLPAEVPYLHAEQDRVERWRHEIGSHGFRIGICWQGSPASVEMGRTFPLAGFRDMANLRSVRLINLQTGAGVEQLDALPDGMEVEDLGERSAAGLRPFVDTAAIMQSLDLIITADTAIAHLAGALGRPAWIVLKQIPDWRWGLNVSTTPWYPTVRLFRQTAMNDWTEAFRQMRQALAVLVGQDGCLASKQ